MNFSAAALRLMADKGLTLLDVAEIVAANDVRADPTANERQKRCRARKVGHGVTVTRDKGSNERDNLTSQAEVSEPSGSSPQPRPWVLPIGVSLQVWTDLLANRKRKRLINTPTAWKGFLEDLARVASQTGIPPPKLIEHAAAKGWGSINVPDEDQGNGRRTNGMGRNQPDGLSSTARAALHVFGPD